MGVSPERALKLTLSLLISSYLSTTFTSYNKSGRIGMIGR